MEFCLVYIGRAPGKDLYLLILSSFHSAHLTLKAVKVKKNKTRDGRRLRI